MRILAITMTMSLLCLVPSRVWAAEAYAAAPAPIKEVKNFVVLGVIASSKNSQGVALIKDKESGQTFAIKEGLDFDKDMTLVRVDRKSIEVKIAGQVHRLFVGDETIQFNESSVTNYAFGSGDFEVKDDVVKVTSQFKEHMIKEKLDTIMMQAASVPYLENGKLKGFTLWDIEQDSVYQQFGLQDGDTVTAINDHDIKDLSSTLKLLTSLKGESQATFKFKRNGVEKSISIVVQ